jgi:hypothetical protein
MFRKREKTDFDLVDNVEGVRIACIGEVDFYEGI